ncbi:Putative uncharacterized protein [Lacticaseibacillus paracasei]|nr:Putative uncharacterized protein [Lacticaseibacillus paracasei]
MVKGHQETAANMVLVMQER